jgi:hypothetical protein
MSILRQRRNKMATQPKVNPTLVNEARHFNGKSVTAVNVNLGVNVTAEFGANGALQAVYTVLAENATPIIIGQVVDLTAGDFDVYFEGDFLELDDYGTNGTDSFIADLQVRIRALGTNVGVRDAVTAAASGESESAGITMANAAVVAVATLASGDPLVDGTAGLVGPGGVKLV